MKKTKKDPARSARYFEAMEDGRFLDEHKYNRNLAPTILVELGYLDRNSNVSGKDIDGIIKEIEGMKVKEAVQHLRDFRKYRAKNHELKLPDHKELLKELNSIINTFRLKYSNQETWLLDNVVYRAVDTIHERMR
jgi:hypothetical protein